MVVVLPRAPDGLAALEAALTAERLEAWVSALGDRRVALSLPRFRIEHGFSLNDALAALGMRRAFADADFSGMVAGGGVFISEVLHKAFVDVDEQGTEAAAATAVIMMRASIGGAGERRRLPRRPPVPVSDPGPDDREHPLHRTRRRPAAGRRRMKVYLSADIEGTAGVALWDQAEKGKPDYQEAREQMTAEVAAACEGLLEGGATEVWVQDAHGTTINIIASRLPEETRLVRGWSGHPFFMVQALDETFGAMVMIGYHSRAGGGGSPLEHTMSGNVTERRINDRPASEFLVHAYAAELLRVPVVFVSGDEALCREVESVNPAIGTVAALEGVGDSTVSLHPAVAVRAIREGAKKALAGDRASAAASRFRGASSWTSGSGSSSWPTSRRSIRGRRSPARRRCGSRPRATTTCSGCSSSRSTCEVEGLLLAASDDIAGPGSRPPRRGARGAAPWASFSSASPRASSRSPSRRSSRS